MQSRFLRSQNKKMAISARLFLFTITVSSLVLTTACGRSFQANEKYSQKDRRHSTISVDPTADSKPVELSLEKSDELADSAELVAIPATLDQSLAGFNEALRYNPKNERAIFWQAFLRVLAESKGALTRVKPLYMQSEKGIQAYSTLLAETKNQSTPLSQSYSDFLLSGPEDIATPAEFNELIDRLRLRLMEFRATLRKLSASEITVTIPSELMPGFKVQTMKDCTEINFGPIRYRNPDPSCNPDASATVGLNRADFEALRFGASSFQIYLELWTAYQMNPQAVIELYSKYNGDFKNRAQAQDFVRRLLDIQRSGQRNRIRPFQGLLEISSDTVSALQYVLDMQRTVCPQGQFAQQNRQGFLFSMGICDEGPSRASGGLIHHLNNLRSLLAGGSIKISQDYKTYAEVIPLKMVNEPIENLHELTPLGFDDCGNLNALNTRSISKYVVSGDINSFLRASTTKSKCYRQKQAEIEAAKRAGATP